MKCGREKNGEHAHDMGACPAATHTASNGQNDGKNGGRICWTIAGTMCGGKKQGTFAEKRNTCLSCAFYSHVQTTQTPENFKVKNSAIPNNPAPKTA